MENKAGIVFILLCMLKKYSESPLKEPKRCPNMKCSVRGIAVQSSENQCFLILIVLKGIQNNSMSLGHFTLLLPVPFAKSCMYYMH